MVKYSVITRLFPVFLVLVLVITGCTKPSPAPTPLSSASVQSVRWPPDIIATAQVEADYLASIGAGFLKGPTGVAVDSGGNIYVADSQNKRVVKFSPDGALLVKWGSEGRGKGQFFIMNSIAVDARGSVYVAADQRIQVFTSDGKFLRVWGGNAPASSFGTKGKFSGPMKIAVDGADNVYVVDLYSLQKFTSDGKLLAFWQPEGPAPDELGIDLSKPYDRELLLPVLARAWPDDLAIDSSGNIYVFETGGYQNLLDVAKYGDNRLSQVRVLSPTVQELAQWVYAEKQMVHGKIAVDNDGHIFIANPINHRVQVFNVEGKLLGTWGEKGSENYQFDNPEDITVDAAGKIYVADYVNNRLQVFLLRESTAGQKSEFSTAPSLPEYVRFEADPIAGWLYGWSILYPGTWIVAKGNPGDTTFLLSDVAHINVTQGRTKGISLNSYVDALLSTMKPEAVLSRRTISLSDGTAAVEVVRELEYPSGRRGRIIYFLVDNQLFIITAQTTGELWDKFNPVFDHMISSFSASKESALAEYVRFQVNAGAGQAYGWSISYPGTWAVARGDPDRAAFVLSDAARVDVTQGTTKGISLEMWVNAVESAKRSGTVLSRRYRELSDGTLAVDVVREYGDGRRERVVYFMVDNQWFTIMAQTTAALWDKFNPVFDQMIGSFAVQK